MARTHPLTIQRHFVPLRVRSRFSPERPSPPDLRRLSTRRAVFSLPRPKATHHHQTEHSGTTRNQPPPNNLPSPQASSSSDDQPQAITPQTHRSPTPSSPNDLRASPAGILIPKPPGEVSQLKRGGYSLSKTVGWSDEVYKAVQVRTHIRRISYHLLPLNA